MKIIKIKASDLFEKTTTNLYTSEWYLHCILPKSQGRRRQSGRSGYGLTTFLPEMVLAGPRFLPNIFFAGPFSHVSF